MLTKHGIGSSRELRPVARREHQEGRIHARRGWPLGVRKEFVASCCGFVGCAAGFGYHGH